jgi:DNA repair exonuclease SbcCD nuclease subunit
MRFVHAADLHLDSPLRSVALRDPELGARLALASRKVLARIVDMCIAHDAEALVLAGDVFDDAEPDLAARAHLVAELARLARTGVPTVVIRGNHDALMDMTRHGPLGADVHLLDADTPTATIRGVEFHGLSFEARHTSESALPRYPQPTHGKRNVGVMHTSLGGAAGHDPYAPCAPGDLMTHGFDYWALGHIHRRSEACQNGAWVVMVGIPQGRHAREPGAGSVTLVTLGEACMVEAVPVAHLAFENATVDMTGCDDAQARAGAAADALAACAAEDHEVALRVELVGDGAAGWADDPRTHLAAVAERFEGLYLERVRLGDVTPPAANQLAGDLVRLMREEAAKPGFRAQAVEMLAQMRAALPPDLRPALEEVLDENGLDALLADGIAGLMARLEDG